MTIRSAFKSMFAWFAGLFTPEVKTMNLSASLTALIVGATAQLTASEGATFASGNPAVLTVDANGLVTAVGAGSASIVATSTADAAQTASVTFTVTAAALAVAVAAVEPAAPTAAEPTELEKLEALIEKLEVTTVKEVKAIIGYIRALA